MKNEITVFSMAGCGPCKMLKQTLKRQCIEHKIVNIDEDPKQAMDRNIRGVPTTIITKGGEEHQRIVGCGVDVLELIQEALNDGS